MWFQDRTGSKDEYAAYLYLPKESRPARGVAQIRDSKSDGQAAGGWPCHKRVFSCWGYLESCGVVRKEQAGQEARLRCGQASKRRRCSICCRMETVSPA